MKHLIYTLTLLLFMAFSGLEAEAQKIAHVDAQSIVMSMPAFKSARSNLDAMATQFKKQLQTQQQGIQAKLATAEAKFAKGELTPADQKKIETELQAENQKILQNEQKYQNDLLKKEEELTGPLYEKIRVAIQDVAKANGYTYVLEAASLLYAEDGNDITGKVKTKLGM